MTTTAVTSWKYSSSSRYLKIFYANGSGDLFYPVSPFIYDNLLRCSDKTAFVQKYLEYDLHFSRITLQG
ncbi:MAG: KTSC domain-containing protein [Acinetobacter sp.]|uniref:KTSC domain-containing protein n=1 Tax=Acinetobacter sp. TaxID=472 RepID=UPI003CFCB042